MISKEIIDNLHKLRYIITTLKSKEKKPLGTPEMLHKEREACYKELLNTLTLGEINYTLVHIDKWNNVEHEIEKYLLVKRI